MGKQAVVVLTPPHYVRGDGKEGIWFGRLVRGVLLWTGMAASGAGCVSPLIVAGDANGGSDLRDFAAHAVEELGVSPGHVVLAFNGEGKDDKNTRGDARAAMRLLAEDSRFEEVEELIVVTCWYHTLRAGLAFEIARQDLFPNGRTLSIRTKSVWEKMPRPHALMGVSLPRPLGIALALVNEARGWVDYTFGRPQKTRGGDDVGKPDFTEQAA